MVGVTPGLPAAQRRGHQVASQSLHIRAGNRSCPHPARIGSPSWVCVRPVGGGGVPYVALTALQPEEPMAGKAGQNLR